MKNHTESEQRETALNALKRLPISATAAGIESEFPGFSGKPCPSSDC